MFVLASFLDIIPIDAIDFHRQYESHLKACINKRYVDRVIEDVGLVIGFYEFIDIQEAKLYNGNSRAYFKASFKMIVFQPFIGEILQGVVTASDSLGLQVSLDFFADVRIVSSHLRDPKVFDPEENTWYWNFEGHKLPYTKDAKMRFRVIESVNIQSDQSVVMSENKKEGVEKDNPCLPPMVILGSVSEDGLGLRSWWEQ